MTKAELILDLKSRALCNALIGQPKLYEVKEDNSKFYGQIIRQVAGNAASYPVIAFYVVNEGLPTEIAYYMDNEPLIYNPLSTTRHVNFGNMLRKNRKKAVDIYRKFKNNENSETLAIIFLEMSQINGGFDIGNKENKILINNLVTENILSDVDKLFIFSFAN